MGHMRRQPTARAKIDWSNSITSGLAFAYLPGNPRDLVTGVLATVTGGAVRQGPSLVLNGSASNGLTMPPAALLGGLQNSTVVAIACGTTSNSALYSESSTSGSDIYKLEDSQGGAQFTYRNDNGNLLQVGQGNVQAADNRLRLFACMKNGATHSSVTALCKPSSVNPFVNDAGLQYNRKDQSIGTTNASFTNGGMTRTIGYSGADGSQNFNGRIDLVLGWTRTLSDAEIHSLASNPYQIFKDLIDHDDELYLLSITSNAGSQPPDGGTTTVVSVSGTASGVSSLTAVARAIYAAYGNAQGVGAGNGQATAITASSGTATGVANVGSSVISIFNTQGQSNGVAAANGVDVAITNTQGQSNGVGSVQARPTAIWNAQGQTTGVAVANGVDTAIWQTSGSSPGVAQSQANTLTIFASNGSTTASASVSGSAYAIWNVNGQSAGISTVNASSSGIAAAGAAGTAVGTSTAGATSVSFFQAVANAIGSASAYGSANAVTQVAGNASGNAAVSGAGGSISSTSATTAGSAAASGKAVGVAATGGSSSGASTVHGDAVMVACATGASTGLAGVHAISVIVYNAQGMSVSASTVQAIATYVAAAIGSATGKATVSGVTEGGLHYTASGDKFSITLTLSPYAINMADTPYKISIND